MFAHPFSNCWYADYREAEDLINIGAYESGSNAGVDEAIDMVGHFGDFFCQGVDESFSLAETEVGLSSLIDHGYRE